MEGTGAVADDDAGPQDADRQALGFVHVEQRQIADRLAACVVAAVLGLRVGRCRAGNGVTGIAQIQAGDRADLDQPLGSGFQAAFGHQFGAADHAALDRFPTVAAAAMRQIDDQGCHPDCFFDVVALGDIAAQQCHPIFEKDRCQILRRARHDRDGAAGLQQMPDRMGADESGAAQQYDIGFFRSFARFGNG